MKSNILFKHDIQKNYFKRQIRFLKKQYNYAFVFYNNKLFLHKPHVALKYNWLMDFEDFWSSMEPKYLELKEKWPKLFAAYHTISGLTDNEMQYLFCRWRTKFHIWCQCSNDQYSLIKEASNDFHLPFILSISRFDNIKFDVPEKDYIDFFVWQLCNNFFPRCSLGQLSEQSIWLEYCFDELCQESLLFRHLNNNNIKEENSKDANFQKNFNTTCDFSGLDIIDNLGLNALDLANVTQFDLRNLQNYKLKPFESDIFIKEFIKGSEEHKFLINESDLEWPEKIDFDTQGEDNSDQEFDFDTLYPGHNEFKEAEGKDVITENIDKQLQDSDLKSLPKKVQLNDYDELFFWLSNTNTTSLSLIKEAEDDTSLFLFQQEILTSKAALNFQEKDFIVEPFSILTSGIKVKKL